MRNIIVNQQFDEERALYHMIHTDLEMCTFAGAADGESVLKEAADITLNKCTFSLRYPLWHVKGLKMQDSKLLEPTRAALWYTKDASFHQCDIMGVKAVRECEGITVTDCKIESTEFGWKSQNIVMKNSQITSEYLFMDSKSVHLADVKMKGKYSFQYIENLEIERCELDTKDAFWHSKNVVVRDSCVKGEYLGWFSENLTLINCRIIGTQPLCYCKQLRLINCTMEEADLAFEYSEVEADVIGTIESVKNPKSGVILADHVSQIIMENAVMECNGIVKLR